MLRGDRVQQQTAASPVLPLRCCTLRCCPCGVVHCCLHSVTSTKNVSPELSCPPSHLRGNEHEVFALYRKGFSKCLLFVGRPRFCKLAPMRHGQARTKCSDPKPDALFSRSPFSRQLRARRGENASRAKARAVSCWQSSSVESASSCECPMPGSRLSALERYASMSAKGARTGQKKRKEHETRSSAAVKKQTTRVVPLPPLDGPWSGIRLPSLRKGVQNWSQTWCVSAGR